MDLESVMCELAGTSNTSIVPLLSLEREQFMCQVSPKNRSWLTYAALCNETYLMKDIVLYSGACICTSATC